MALSRDSESPYMKDFARAFADREEAITYLASIIPKESKDRIQMAIESDPDFRRKQHLFLGMKVRNALRTGGFFYLPENMDLLWFALLKRAVNLPEDKIIPTNRVRTSIEKYREQELLENPPICPPLETEQINQIIKQFEERFKISMPKVEVRYSEYAKGSFFLVPPSFNTDEFVYAKRERNSRLKFRGLREQELEQIDSSKHTIFLATRQPKQQIGLYASAWHESAHVAAEIIGIKSRVLNESFATANEFRGLLLAVKEERFRKQEVIDTIEHKLRQMEHERMHSSLFSKLKTMGIKGIDRDYTTAIHHSALNTIKEYNPDLRFQNREIDELLVEWDNIVEHVLHSWSIEKWKSRIPVIISLIFLILLPIILIAMILLLGQ